jgi:hypothetical protein
LYQKKDRKINMKWDVLLDFMELFRSWNKPLFIFSVPSASPSMLFSLRTSA